MLKGRKSRVSKKLCQRLHLEKRMAQRFGILHSNEKYDRLKAMINSGEAKFLEKETGRLRHYLIPEFEGKSFEIVWDSKRHQIVTAFKHGGQNEPAKC